MFCGANFWDQISVLETVIFLNMSSPSGTKTKKDEKLETQTRLYSPLHDPNDIESKRQKFFEESTRDRLHEYGLIEGTPPLCISDPYEDPDILSIYFDLTF